jgi:hypothetical protein
MLFRETVAVYCENHTEHTNTLCGQNINFLFVKVWSTYSNEWALQLGLWKILPWDRYELSAYEQVEQALSPRDQRKGTFMSGIVSHCW